MTIRTLYCEACGKPTPHQVDDGHPDEDDLALCTLCGRLSSPPPESNVNDSRHRDLPQR